MNKIKYTQNFLTNTDLVKKLVNDSSINSGNTVIEIGPGKGIITKHLAKKVGYSGKVIGLELDGELCKKLKQDFSQIEQIKLLCIDARKYDWQKETNYKVFSNIPFMFTSDLMNILTNVTTGPKLGYVILQKESALMYGGFDLGSSNSLKSLLAGPFYEFKIVHNFSKSDFYPRPAVESVLLKFAKKAKPLLSVDDFDLWADFLAFVSQDRGGEGNWKKLFSKTQLVELANKGLIIGRGMKSQKMDAIIYAFSITKDSDLEKIFAGTMGKLQVQQSKIVKKNRTRKSRSWKNTN